MDKENSLRQMLVISIVFAFFAATYIYTVYASYTSAPYFDNWRLFAEDRYFYTKILSHNEHIINFIAAFFWMDNNFLSGRGTLQLTAIACMLAALSVFFAIEIRKNLPQNILLCSAVAMSCLSATQFTNITWSFQVGFVGCFAFGFLSIYCLSRASASHNQVLWLLLSGLSAIASSLTLAAGVLLIGFVGIYCLFLRIRPIWKLAFLLSTISIFFILLVVNHPDRHETSIKSIRYAILFTLAVLGSFPGTAIDYRFLGIGLPERVYDFAAILFGAIFVLSALCLILRAYQSWRSDLVPLARLWGIPFGLWLALSASAIGWGRSELPIAEAISARYVTISVLFMCALFATAAQLRVRQVTTRPVQILCVLLIAAASIAQVNRMAQAEIAGRRFENAETALLNNAYNAPDILNLYPASMDQPAKLIASIMQLRGLSLFGEARYRLISKNLFSGALTYKGTCASQISNIDRGPAWLLVEGSVNDEATGLKTDIVAAADLESNIKAVGTVRKQMIGLRQEGTQSGFVLIAPTSNMPAISDLSFFALDMSALAFCYMGKS